MSILVLKTIEGDYEVYDSRFSFKIKGKDLSNFPTMQEIMHFDKEIEVLGKKHIPARSSYVYMSCNDGPLSQDTIRKALAVRGTFADHRKRESRILDSLEKGRTPEGVFFTEENAEIIVNRLTNIA